MLGEPTGLTGEELNESINTTGKGERYEPKTNQWKESNNIDMSSHRRGTFFGTVDRNVAHTPEMKLRRIVETVAMLKAK